MHDEVPLAEVARRVGLSAQMVGRLAKRDPAFPPCRRVGAYWLVSLAKAEQYFANRQGKPGRPPRRPTSER